MVLTVNEERQKMWVVKEDGSAITHDEYKKLGAKLEIYLGGPANAHWRIGLNHWEEKSPVFFTPVKIERKNHEGLFHDFTEMIYFLKEKGYITFGVLEWKETGEWEDVHFRVALHNNDDNDNEFEITKGKVVYEKFED